MKELVEVIAKALVDCPDEVSVSEKEEGTVIRKDGTALFFSAETVVKLKKQGESRKGTDAGLSRAD